MSPLGLIAQLALPTTIGGWATLIVVVAAVAAIIVVAVWAMGLKIPPWAIQIGSIVLIALVALVAIQLVLSAVRG